MSPSFVRSFSLLIILMRSCSQHSGRARHSQGGRLRASQSVEGEELDEHCTECVADLNGAMGYLAYLIGGVYKVSRIFSYHVEDFLAHG